MKRKLLWCLALTGLLATTSCSQDETVDEPTPQRKAIGFSTFINKTTRSSYDVTTDKLDKIVVWGMMSKKNGDGTTDFGYPFNRVDVTKLSGAWQYATPVYWQPGFNYTFLAVAPAANISVEGSGRAISVTPPKGVSEADCGTINFTNVEGKIDLVAAFDKTFVTTPIDATASNAQEIGFDMQHLLTQLDFAFTNRMLDKSEITVYEVYIKDSFYEGNAAVKLNNDGSKTTCDWSIVGSEKTTLSFGTATIPVGTAASGKEAGKIAFDNTFATDGRYMIPSKQAVNVTFKINHTKNGVTTSSDKSVTIAPPDGEWKPGYHYRFTGVIDSNNIEDNPLKPITFSASVGEWEKSLDNTITITGKSEEQP